MFFLEVRIFLQNLLLGRLHAAVSRPYPGCKPNRVGASSLLSRSIDLCICFDFRIDFVNRLGLTFLTIGFRFRQWRRFSNADEATDWLWDCGSRRESGSPSSFRQWVILCLFLDHVYKMFDEMPSLGLRPKIRIERLIPVSWALFMRSRMKIAVSFFLVGKGFPFCLDMLFCN